MRDQRSYAVMYTIQVVEKIKPEKKSIPGSVAWRNRRAENFGNKLAMRSSTYSPTGPGIYTQLCASFCGNIRVERGLEPITSATSVSIS